MNKVGEVSLLSLIPPNLLEDEQVVNSAKALDKSLQELHNFIPKTIVLPSIDSLDENIVDLLAIQFDAPFYDPQLDIEKKRILVKNSINWHKRKGTVGVIEELVSTVFSESKVIEWYEYDGRPYRFKVITTDPITDPEVYKQFHKAIYSVKNVRSWLDNLGIEREYSLGLHYAASVHIGKEITVRNDWMPIFKESQVNKTFNSGVHIGKEITVGGV